MTDEQQRGEDLHAIDRSFMREALGKLAASLRACADALERDRGDLDSAVDPQPVVERVDDELGELAGAVFGCRRAVRTLRLNPSTPPAMKGP